mmetsp:Transcript_23763/g.61737  ORF Transcript_23763/g.61737 Transcript_23763/m.61737 type:complete len:207 (-) Transcript_23763:39-659(-)
MVRLVPAGVDGARYVDGHQHQRGQRSYPSGAGVELHQPVGVRVGHDYHQRHGHHQHGAHRHREEDGEREIHRAQSAARLVGRGNRPKDKAATWAEPPASAFANSAKQVDETSACANVLPSPPSPRATGAPNRLLLVRARVGGATQRGADQRVGGRRRYWYDSTNYYVRQPSRRAVVCLLLSRGVTPRLTRARLPNVVPLGYRGLQA